MESIFIINGLLIYIYAFDHNPPHIDVKHGGEEFTILLPDTGKTEAILVAERIRSTIDEHDFVYNNQHLHVTISVGVSVFDVNTNLVNSPNEFVNQADQGLYMSKSNGRNKVTYFEPKKK